MKRHNIFTAFIMFSLAFLMMPAFGMSPVSSDFYTEAEQVCPASIVAELPDMGPLSFICKSLAMAQRSLEAINFEPQGVAETLQVAQETNLFVTMSDSAVSSVGCYHAGSASVDGLNIIKNDFDPQNAYKYTGQSSCNIEPRSGGDRASA